MYVDFRYPDDEPPPPPRVGWRDVACAWLLALLVIALTLLA